MNIREQISWNVRQVIEADMEQFLETLKTHASVGLVGGSDLVKIAEQMKGKNKNFY